MPNKTKSPATPDNKQPNNQPSYSEAATELSLILNELEQSKIDIDELATKVARAAELVSHCRNRLAAVSADVDSVVAKLVQPETDSNP